MKINNISSNFNAIIAQNKKHLSQNSNNNDKHIDAYTINPQEYLGKSLINFKGKENEFTLTKMDSDFLKAVSATLQLSKEDAAKLEKIFKDFLSENGYKALKELNGFDHITDQAIICETVEKEFNLSEMENTAFTCELTEMIIRGDKYKPKVDKYNKDYSDFEKICNKYNIDEDHCLKAYYRLKDEAEFLDLDSIFDAVNKHKSEFSTPTIMFLQRNLGIQDDTMSDFLIDMSLASKNQKTIRNKPQKDQTDTTKFYRNVAEQFIAKDIMTGFGLSKKSYDFLKSELENRNETKNKSENLKVAFNIADKYNLEKGSETTILKIIDGLESKDSEYFDRILFSRFKSMGGL